MSLIQAAGLSKQPASKLATEAVTPLKARIASLKTPPQPKVAYAAAATGKRQGLVTKLQMNNLLPHTRSRKRSQRRPIVRSLNTSARSVKPLRVAISRTVELVDLPKDDVVILTSRFAPCSNNSRAISAFRFESPDPSDAFLPPWQTAKRAVVPQSVAFTSALYCSSSTCTISTLRLQQAQKRVPPSTRASAAPASSSRHIVATCPP